MRCQLCEKEVNELFELQTSSKRVCCDCLYPSCSCCGKMISQDENLVTDEVPYPFDIGYGMCKECGGDEDANTIEGQLGWAIIAFYEARFPVVRGKLNPDNQTKWDALSFLSKCDFVKYQIERGRMI